MLTNLLSNAIKFTPAHGSIVVHVEGFGDEIRFAVSDTGVGIATDKLEAVFVRFLQVTENDRRGVGLGLYMSLPEPPSSSCERKGEELRNEDIGRALEANTG